jgi:dihydroflavonol-4-reductase
MKTLVTGANGLLGANVVRELLKRNHEVSVLLRKGADDRTIRGLDIQIHHGDLSDESVLKQACNGVNFVIHAAGKAPGAQVRFSDYAETNIKGTKNIIHAAEEAGVERIVHVSSCCVYSGGTIEEPGTELSEFTGFKYNSGYINSKYLAQQWVLSEVERKKAPVVIVNPTLMLGPYDIRPTSGDAILKVLNLPYQFCPMGGKNFVDVRDAAFATCNALTMGTVGECYLLASENLSFADFYRKVNRNYGRDGFRIMVPDILVKSVGLIGNAVSTIMKQDLEWNYVNASQMTCESYFSAKKAIRSLNLPQHPVEQAIRDAIDWFIANQYLAPRTEQGFLVPEAA